MVAASFLHLLEREPLSIIGSGFFTDQMRSCHLSNSVKALKETQSTDPNL